MKIVIKMDLNLSTKDSALKIKFIFMINCLSGSFSFSISSISSDKRAPEPRNSSYSGLWPYIVGKLGPRPTETSHPK